MNFPIIVSETALRPKSFGGHDGGAKFRGDPCPCEVCWTDRENARLLSLQNWSAVQDARRELRSEVNAMVDARMKENAPPNFFKLWMIGTVTCVAISAVTWVLK